MLKKMILASVAVTGMVLLSGCSSDDVADAYGVDAYGDVDGNYAYCAYYTDTGYEMHDTCTASPSSYVNSYSASCTPASYSYSYCSDYLDSYNAPSKAPGREVKPSTVDEAIESYNASLPSE